KPNSAGIWSLQAYAFCADPPPGLEIVSATSAAGSSNFQGVNVRCSARKQTVGAGGRINGGGNRVNLVTQALGTAISTGTSASGIENPNGFAGTWSVTAFAVCVTPVSVSDLQVVTSFSGSSTGNRAFAQATCPAGMRVTGGAAFADIPGVVDTVAPVGFGFSVQGIARNNSPELACGTSGITVYAFCSS
ncbi:MAG TPA: hypothetical protein VF469_10135, partial [Kofleriaceae bacterium]